MTLFRKDADGAAQVPHIARLANALFDARRNGHQIPALADAEANSLSLADGMAVQREVGRLRGLPIAGWKAGLVPNVRFTYAAAYAPDVLHSPAHYRVPCTAVRREDTTMFVEGEVAFRLARTLDARAAPYSDDEVAEAIDCCCAAIEIGNPRLANFDAAPLAHKLADSMGNGAIVCGTGVAHWRALAWDELHVVMTLDGKVVVDHAGGGKGGDPFATLVALVNAADRDEPLQAGHVVITGNRTGFHLATPRSTLHVAFDGLGEASVGFE
jgi:2-keto-4-pentenoate hydratase